MKQKTKGVACLLLSLLPLAYLAFVWTGLPPVVPTHFDLAGTPNGYSSRSTLWLLTGFLSLSTMGTWLLLTNLHRIDPKRRGTAPSRAFMKLADGLVLFTTAINGIALLAMTGHPVAMTRLILPVTGLLFAFLGNIMYSIRPNYFAGIRLPWTLADDANWRATHRVAGTVWVIGGLLIVTGSLLMPPRHLGTMLLWLILSMVFVPVGYSFWHFRQSHTRKI